MTALANQLAGLGFHLRSGKAEGADWAFQKGAMEANGTMTIYKPDEEFGSDRCSDVTNDFILSPHLMEVCQGIAKTVHGAWHKCTYKAKRFHGRNVCQVLGHNLNRGVLEPELSWFVLYWAPVKDKKVKGGTATAVNLAKKYGIPTINMLDNDWEWQLTCVLNSILHDDCTINI